MKKINILLFIVLINIFSIVFVSAASNPYKETCSFGVNCTWYAWKMAYEKAGITLPGWGDAKEWYNDAKNDGYSVGSTPKANSIIVWGDWTSYGHVGYVERVEGNILHVWDSTGPCIDEEDSEYIECMANSVCEETDRACKKNAKRIACEYDISASNYTITGYIYLDTAPKKITSSNTTKKEETSSTKKETKSKNAYASNIEISNGTIEFNKDVYEYSVEVENEIDILTINAIPEDEKATISGTGDIELKVGLNEIKLTVTAEDKSKKDYTIKVTRKEKIEEKEETNTSDIKNKDIINKINNKKNIILISSVILTTIIVSLIFIFIRKTKKKKC